MQQKVTMLQFPFMFGGKTEWKVTSSQKLVLVTITIPQHFYSDIAAQINADS